jgi:hypothetical protein
MEKSYKVFVQTEDTDPDKGLEKNITMSFLSFVNFD